MSLNPAETLALAKVLKDETVKDARKGVVPGVYPIDTLVRVKGEIKVGEDYLRKPTVKIPMKAAMAFLVRRMGFQRDAALEMMKQAMTDAFNADEQAEEYVQALGDLEVAEKQVNDMLSKLPKASCAGPVTTSLTVEKID